MKHVLLVFVVAACGGDPASPDAAPVEIDAGPDADRTPPACLVPPDGNPAAAPCRECLVRRRRLDHRGPLERHRLGRLVVDQRAGLRDRRAGLGRPRRRWRRRPGGGEHLLRPHLPQRRLGRLPDFQRDGYGLDAGDLDGDGDLDVAVSVEWPIANASDVPFYVLRNVSVGGTLAFDVEVGVDLALDHETLHAEMLYLSPP